MSDSSPFFAKILVFDDNPSHVEIIEEILGAAIPQISVVSCSNSKDFFRLLKETRFDAVLLDYRLPLSNGIEILKQIDFQSMPVIMMSSDNDDQIANRSFEAGSCDFIIKSKTSLKTLPLILRRRIEQIRHQQVTSSGTCDT